MIKSFIMAHTKAVILAAACAVAAAIAIPTGIHVYSANHNAPEETVTAKKDSKSEEKQDKKQEKKEDKKSSDEKDSAEQADAENADAATSETANAEQNEQDKNSASAKNTAGTSKANAGTASNGNAQSSAQTSQQTQPAAQNTTKETAQSSQTQPAQTPYVQDLEADRKKALGVIPESQVPQNIVDKVVLTYGEPSEWRDNRNVGLGYGAIYDHTIYEHDGEGNPTYSFSEIYYNEDGTLNCLGG